MASQVNASALGLPADVVGNTTAGTMLVRIALSAFFYAGVILRSVVPATRKRLQSYPQRWSKMDARAGQALTSTAEVCARAPVARRISRAHVCRKPCWRLRWLFT